jgi:hypothetical protein
MPSTTYYTALGFISVTILVGVIIDQAYQRLSHKWTNEPPLLPYRIPFVGHALMFRSDCFGLFRAAQYVNTSTGILPLKNSFPEILVGNIFLIANPTRSCSSAKESTCASSFSNLSPQLTNRMYQMFKHNKDVSVVFRKSKALPFLPLIEKLSGLALDISSDGMNRLSEVDDTGDSIFRNAHVFYRDALKVGPELDVLTVNFLRYLDKEFNEFETKPIPTGGISLLHWSKTMLGTASTNAMMGPALLRENPDLLPHVWLVEQGFVFFVNRVPSIFARKHYRARKHVLAAFTRYFEDEKNKEGSASMMWEREAQLRAKGVSTRDVAGYSYAAYTVGSFPNCDIRVTGLSNFLHSQAYVLL